MPKTKTPSANIDQAKADFPYPLFPSNPRVECQKTGEHERYSVPIQFHAGTLVGYPLTATGWIYLDYVPATKTVARIYGHFSVDVDDKDIDYGEVSRHVLMLGGVYIPDQHFWGIGREPSEESQETP